jgi:hypothetical protein
MNCNLWTKKEEETLVKLFKAGKTYQEISNSLPERSAEAVRKKIKNIKTENISTASESDMDFLENQVRAARLALKRRSEIKTINALLKKEAEKSIVAEKIESSVKLLKNINKVNLNFNFPKNPKEEIVVLLSDLHCGLAVNPEETGNLGNYSKEIFEERMDSFTKSLLNITENHRKISNIETLNIFCLGDIVHGMSNVGKWSPAYMDQDIMDQVFSCVDLMKEKLYILGHKFNKVKFYGIVGNHGRIAQKDQEKEYANWDYIIYKFIESAFKNCNNFEFFIDKSWMKVAKVFNEKFLLVHGDELGGLSGMASSEQKYKGLIQCFKDEEEAKILLKPQLDKLRRSNSSENISELINSAINYSKSFDSLVCGHIHNPNIVSTSSGGNIITNGSFIGGDNYSLKKLQSYSKPSQKVFGVSEDGITWHYDIKL